MNVTASSSSFSNLRGRLRSVPTSVVSEVEAGLSDALRSDLVLVKTDAKHSDPIPTVVECKNKDLAQQIPRMSPKRLVI